jgi:hypothetical protein
MEYGQVTKIQRPNFLDFNINAFVLVKKKNINGFVRYSRLLIIVKRTLQVYTLFERKIQTSPYERGRNSYIKLLSTSKEIGN